MSNQSSSILKRGTMAHALSHLDELFQTYQYYQQKVNDLESEDAIRQDVSYLYKMKKQRDYYKDEYQGYLNAARSTKSLH
jgi:uncharacterized protein YdcH (DUF465 family)